MDLIILLVNTRQPLVTSLHEHNYFALNLNNFLPSTKVIQLQLNKLPEEPLRYNLLNNLLIMRSQEKNLSQNPDSNLGPPVF